MGQSFKGAITFGLVYIPISLSTCIKNNDIGFNLIDKKSMKRIRYKKTCEDCDNKEVKKENIVKAYQYQKGKYVIFNDKDFEKIKSEKDKNITIEQFVNLSEVDPVYFDKAYFVTPLNAEKAFLMLLKAMEKQKKAAVAKTVLGTKETLLLLRVKGGKMIANTLFFYEELQKAPLYENVTSSKKELELATKLIDQMSEKFEIENFKDEYNIKLKKAIKTKIAGKKIITESTPYKTEKIVNIMDALKKSINQKGKLKNGIKKVQKKA